MSKMRTGTLAQIVWPVPKELHRGAPSVILSAAKNLSSFPRSFATLRMTRKNSRVAKLLERAIAGRLRMPSACYGTRSVPAALEYSGA